MIVGQGWFAELILFQKFKCHATLITPAIIIITTIQRYIKDTAIPFDAHSDNRGHTS